MSTPTVGIDVITLPVDNVDRTKDRCVALGFHLDVHYAPNPAFSVVQLTPPGSAASIQFGVGLTDATPGSVRETYHVDPTSSRPSSSSSRSARRSATRRDAGDATRRRRN